MALLLDYGASISAIDSLQRTTLHHAVRQNDLDIAELLLNRGVEVNALDKYGEQALDIAVEKDKLPMVTLLVRLGANLMRTVPPNMAS